MFERVVSYVVGISGCLEVCATSSEGWMMPQCVVDCVEEGPNDALADDPSWRALIFGVTAASVVRYSRFGRLNEAFVLFGVHQVSCRADGPDVAHLCFFYCWMSFFTSRALPG
ncbi:hypothetical protein M5689_018971 [Euphorbia peplus]|nr:hypothetical protein M5689_018971 [Euphorbia peplus]